jgi:simple sugar transport system permease protein
VKIGKSKIGFEKTEATPAWLRSLIPALALLVTFILTSGLIVWAKASPFSAYYYFLVAPLSNRMSALEVLVKSTPLILVGSAVTVAFVGGYYNIGAEGQLYAGAIIATWLGVALGELPGIILIPLMFLGGFLAGLAWALVPALLRVRLAVDEVVTTVLLNSVMLYIVSALLNGPWRNPASGWPQSEEIAPSAMLPKLVPRSRLHIGFIVALLTVAVLWFVLSRTPFGLKMRAVGLGKAAARFAGVNVERTMLISALVSGGLAGITGVVELAGIQFHLIGAFSPGYGYTGILIATLAALNPLGVVAAGLFFGLIDTGTQTVSRALGVPVYLGQVTQATMLLVTLAMLLLQRYRIRIRRA